MRKFQTERRAVWLASLLLFPAFLAAHQASAAETPSSTDLLLNLFVEKGYVSQQEADKVKAEAAKREAQLKQFQSEAAQYKTQLGEVKSEMAALKARTESYNATNMPSLFPRSKWVIGPGIKSIRLFADARVRYEARTAQDPGGSKISLSRERLSLRFGLRGKAVGNLSYGFRIETSSNPRSSWITLGNTTSSSGYQAPFGKSSGGLNVGRLYIGWQPEDWVNLTVGKMANPLYTSSLVWDSDLNPEGLAEQFHYTVGEADLFANFGQFLYASFNPYNTSSGFLGFNNNTLYPQNNNDILMFAWQGGMKYHITPDVTAKIAATVYNYTGLQRTPLNNNQSSALSALKPYFGDPYVGEGAYYYYHNSQSLNAQGNAGYGSNPYPIPGYDSVNYPFNQVGLNNLLVLEVPFELDFKIHHLAAQIFGDFAYNLDGAQRARDAANAYSYILNSPQLSSQAQPHSFPAQTSDVKAYQIGFGIGSTNFDDGSRHGADNGSETPKHAWQLRTYWQHIEQYSLDPNLINSDFFEGRENMEGIYASLAYAFTPNFIATVRYGYAHRINSLLGTGGSNQDIPWMNPIQNFHLFQVDATFRF